MKRLILTLMLILGGCSYFEKPVDEFYLYETTTRKCFKVQEFKNEYKWGETDCRKISRHIYQIETPSAKKYMKDKAREYGYAGGEEE